MLVRPLWDMWLFPARRSEAMQCWSTSVMVHILHCPYLCLGLPLVLQVLVRFGADITTPTGSGSGPLHAAAYMGHVDVVGFLVQMGSPVNRRRKVVCGSPCWATRAHRAAQRGADKGPCGVIGVQGTPPGHRGVGGKRRARILQVHGSTPQPNTGTSPKNFHYRNFATYSVFATYSETGKICKNGGKWVQMCHFSETEWENDDKPPKKRWKLVVSVLMGHRASVILGNGRRKNGGKCGKLGKNMAEVGDIWGGGGCMQS